MRLGFLTNLSDDVIRTARAIGFNGLEVHAGTWQAQMDGGKASIDKAVTPLKAALDEAGIEITALANYRVWIGQKPADVLKTFKQRRYSATGSAKTASTARAGGGFAFRASAASIGGRSSTRCTRSATTAASPSSTRTRSSRANGSTRGFGWGTTHSPRCWGCDRRTRAGDLPVAPMGGGRLEIQDAPRYRYRAWGG
jgi:hypothetical protein